MDTVGKPSKHSQLNHSNLNDSLNAKKVNTSGLGTGNRIPGANNGSSEDKISLLKKRERDKLRASASAGKKGGAKTLQQRTKIHTEKNRQEILAEKLQYRPQIAAAGGPMSMAFGILVDSFKVLEERIRRSPRNSIRLNIPATLIFSFEASISYLYTNALGYLELSKLNGPDDSDDSEDHHHPAEPDNCCDPVVNLPTSLPQPASDLRNDTMTNKAIHQVIDILNDFHDFTYSPLYSAEKSTRETRSGASKGPIFPIAVIKFRGDDNDNAMELHYFTNSVLNKIVKNHQREFFIVQRYVVSRGFCPSLIRCELNIKRYPDIDFKTIQEQETQRVNKQYEQKNKRREIENSSDDSRSEIHQSDRKTNFDKTISEPNRNLKSSLKHKKSYDNLNTALRNQKPEDQDARIERRIAQIDQPKINLKVFKISSKVYFDGQQLTKRIPTLQTNPVNTSSGAVLPKQNAKDQTDVNPAQTAAKVTPIIRLDEQFMIHILENNPQYQRRRKLRQMFIDNFYEQQLKSNIASADPQRPDLGAAGQNLEHEYDLDHCQRIKFEEPNLSWLKTYRKLKEDRIFGIFFRKTEKDFNVAEELFASEIYQLQCSIQKDLNDHMQGLNSQFTVQERDFSVQANIVETNNKEGFRTEHSVNSIMNEDTATLRENIEQVLKQVLKVQPYVSKLAIDFIREGTSIQAERNVFLQFKYAQTDQFLNSHKIQSMRPPKVTQEMTRCQTDFILNTRPLISSLDGLRKRMGGELVTQEQSMRLTSTNLKGQPIEVRCGGDYCNIEDMMGLQKDMPDYHYEKLTKMSNDNDNEKKGTTLANFKSFGAADDHILPESENMSYKVPNMIILIDQDIKSLWQEQIVIKGQLEKIRNLNNAVIEEIYQQYLNSLAGKKFQHSSAQTRYRMKNVCHQCYKFYLALFKEVVTANGKIKIDTLHRLSDPLYQLGQDKEKKFDEISKVIRKSLKKKLLDLFKTNVLNAMEVAAPGSNKKSKDEGPKKSLFKTKSPQKKLLLNKNQGTLHSLVKLGANSNQKQSGMELKPTGKESLDSTANRMSALALFGKRSGSQSAPRKNSIILGQQNLQKVDAQKAMNGRSQSQSKRQMIDQPNLQSSQAAGGAESKAGESKKTLNNLLGVIFDDVNEAHRPIQPTMPRIYERHKMMQQEMALQQAERLPRKRAEKMPGLPPISAGGKRPKAGIKLNKTLQKNPVQGLKKSGSSSDVLAKPLLGFKTLQPVRSQHQNLNKAKFDATKRNLQVLHSGGRQAEVLNMEGNQFQTSSDPQQVNQLEKHLPASFGPPGPGDVDNQSSSQPDLKQGGARQQLSAPEDEEFREKASRPPAPQSLATKQGQAQAYEGEPRGLEEAADRQQQAAAPQEQDNLKDKQMAKRRSAQQRSQFQDGGKGRQGKQSRSPKEEDDGTTAHHYEDLDEDRPQTLADSGTASRYLSPTSTISSNKRQFRRTNSVNDGLHVQSTLEDQLGADEDDKSRAENLRAEASEDHLIRSLNSEFSHQKVMKLHLLGKDTRQILAAQSSLTPNQKSILRLRQLQIINKYYGPRKAERNVEAHDQAAENELGAAALGMGEDQVVRHHVRQQVRDQLKEEQMESKNLVNQFVKRVNSQKIESIVASNSISYKMSAQIAYDTYDKCAPKNQWTKLAQDAQAAKRGRGSLRQGQRKKKLILTQKHPPEKPTDQGQLPDPAPRLTTADAPSARNRRPALPPRQHQIPSPDHSNRSAQQPTTTNDNEPVGPGPDHQANVPSQPSPPIRLASQVISEEQDALVPNESPLLQGQGNGLEDGGQLDIPEEIHEQKKEMELPAEELQFAEIEVEEMETECIDEVGHVDSGAVAEPKANTDGVPEDDEIQEELPKAEPGVNNQDVQVKKQISKPPNQRVGSEQTPEQPLVSNKNQEVLQAKPRKTPHKAQPETTAPTTIKHKPITKAPKPNNSTLKTPQNSVQHKPFKQKPSSTSTTSITGKSDPIKLPIKDTLRGSTIETKPDKGKSILSDGQGQLKDKEIKDRQRKQDRKQEKELELKEVELLHAKEQQRFLEGQKSFSLLIKEIEEENKESNVDQEDQRVEIESNRSLRMKEMKLFKNQDMIKQNRQIEGKQSKITFPKNDEVKDQKSKQILKDQTERIPASSPVIILKEKQIQLEEAKTQNQQVIQKDESQVTRRLGGGSNAKSPDENNKMKEIEESAKEQAGQGPTRSLPPVQADKAEEEISALKNKEPVTMTNISINDGGGQGGDERQGTPPPLLVVDKFEKIEEVKIIWNLDEPRTPPTDEKIDQEHFSNSIKTKSGVMIPKLRLKPPMRISKRKLFNAPPHPVAEAEVIADPTPRASVPGHIEQVLRRA